MKLQILFILIIGGFMSCSRPNQEVGAYIVPSYSSLEKIKLDTVYISTSEKTYLLFPEPLSWAKPNTSAVLVAINANTLFILADQGKGVNEVLIARVGNIIYEVPLALNENKKRIYNVKKLILVSAKNVEQTANHFKGELIEYNKYMDTIFLEMDKHYQIKFPSKVDWVDYGHSGYYEPYFGETEKIGEVKNDSSIYVSLRKKDLPVSAIVVKYGDVVFLGSISPKH